MGAKIHFLCAFVVLGCDYEFRGRRGRCRIKMVNLDAQNVQPFSLLAVASFLAELFLKQISLFMQDSPQMSKLLTRIINVYDSYCLSST